MPDRMNAVENVAILPGEQFCTYIMEEEVNRSFIAGINLPLRLISRLT